MNNIKSIVEKRMCRQCGACAIACPKKCINMTMSNRGQTLPEIDESICINCGICSNVCYYLNESIGNTPLSIFSGKSTDNIIFNKSSSGGGVTTIVYNLFEMKVINKVLTTISEGKEARSILFDNYNDYEKSIGSKYQPNYGICGLSSLKPTDRIAVIGLPCQIKAVERLIDNKIISNNQIIIKIGLFCVIGRGQQGTNIELRNYKKIDNLAYREGDAKQCFVARSGDRIIHKISADIFKQKYDYFFMPKSCICCTDIFNSCSDISFGDAWGLSNEKRNMVCVHTKKGMDAIKIVIHNKKYMAYEELSYQDLISTQKNGYYFKVLNAKLNSKVINKEAKSIQEIYPIWNKIGLYFLLINDRLFNSSFGERLFRMIPSSILYLYRDITLKMIFFKKDYK